MSRLAKRLAPWVGGAVVGSALTCASMVAWRVHDSEKWAESERLLSEAMSGAAASGDFTVECVDCDWAAFRTQLPAVAYSRCHDTVAFSWGWGLECFAHFKDGSCLSADVYENDGQWRVSVAGHLTRRCS